MVTTAVKARAVLRLVRPELPAAAGVCVVLGQAIGLGRLPSPVTLGSGFALGFFLSSSAMIFNDYFDLEVDRVNAPYRPLPAGQLTPREAVVSGVVAAGIAFAIALALQPILLVLSMALWALGFLYNWRLKAAGLWGNLIVSANVAMTFIIGGISVGRAASLMLWTFSLIAGLFDLGEEIAGDAMDMVGDQKRGSRSIALVSGKAAALRISTLLFGAVIALTGLPLVWGQTGPGYWLPIAATDALVVFFTARLLRSRTPEQGRAAMRGLYISASLGLVGFILGTFLKV